MMSRLVLIALLASIVALTSGCLLFVAGAAAGAGVGTYAYVSGELRSSEAVKLDKAWNAAQAAMKDLGYTVTEKQKNGLEGKLIARGPGDKKVQVNLVKKSDTVTEIRVRVGTFGDEGLSRQILDKIKSHF
jgi:hypothetical protein